MITHAQAPSASSSRGHLGGATLACTELVQSKSRGALGRRFCSAHAHTRANTHALTQPHTQTAHTRKLTQLREKARARTRTHTNSAHAHSHSYAGARAHLVHNWFGVSPVAPLALRVVRATPCKRVRPICVKCIPDIFTEKCRLSTHGRTRPKHYHVKNVQYAFTHT